MTISSRASCPADQSSASPSRPPEREVEAAGAGREVVALDQQVELEHVHHLVAHGVPELGEVAPERQRDPALEEVGGAEQPFGRRERQDVGLLEVGVRGVDDERDAGRHRVAELHAQRVVARLGVGQRRRGEVGLGRSSSRGRRAGPS